MKRPRLVPYLIVVIGMASLLALPMPAGSKTRAGQGTAIDLAGNPVNPLKASAGKVVVLIFVRTDCPISNRYAPTIQHLSADFAGHAAFWLVYPSKEESAEAIRKHDNEYGYKIPAVRDPQKVLVKEGHAQITPEAAVFSATGELVYHGRIDNLYVDLGKTRTIATTHELNDAIRAALSGKPFAPENSHAVGCYISDLE